MKQIYLKEKDRFQGMLEEAALVESWKTEGQLLSKLDGQLRVILLRIEEAAVDLNKKSSMKIFRTKVQGLLEEMETELLCGMIPIRLKSPESLTEFAMKKLISIRNEVTSGMKADLRHYFTEKSGVLYSKLLLAYFTEAKIIAIGLERWISQ